MAVNILALGAGVQSTCLLGMSCLGLVPKLDHAIFADTGWEPKRVYENLEFLKVFSLSHGIPIHVVSAGNLRSDALERKERLENGARIRGHQMPVFLTGDNGEKGILRRSCTKTYKIEPKLKKIRELIGLKRGQRGPNDVVVDQWFGISLDEVHRIRRSDQRWMSHSYPLIDLNFRRLDCIEWVKENMGITPVRSACIGCPFHGEDEWRNIKRNEKEWSDACAFDEEIRHYPLVRGTGYLHPQRVPLPDIDFNTAEKQLDLWGNECHGECGV